MMEIFECNFNDLQHRSAVIMLMNHYMGDQMGGMLSPHTKEKAEQMVEGLAVHPSKLVLLVKQDHEFIGLMNCFVNFGTFTARPFINIHDIVVLDKYRGKGVGRWLMEEITKRARQMGCGKITLEVREDNGRAQALYRSMGFDESQPVMHFWSKYL